MSQNSNDFFNSFEGTANSSSNGVQQRKVKPPPPPRRPAATTTSTMPSGSYYGGTAATNAPSATASRPTSSVSVRQPPPPIAQTAATTAQRPTTTSASYYNAPSYNAAPTNTSSNYSQNNNNTSALSQTPSYGGNSMYSANRNMNTTTATAPTYNAAATTYGSNTTVNAPVSASDWYTDYSTADNMTADASAASNPYMNPYPTGSLSGSMEPSPAMTDHSIPAATPSYFTPTMNMTTSSSTSSFQEDMENEPPLLEELGINLQQIFMKTKAVVIPFRRLAGNTALMDPSLIVEDADLAGPLVFALALGFELLLGLEVEFGAIYGFGLAGCVSMTLILNLMSPTQAVSFWTVTSILGYALLPVNILAALKILLQNLAGFSTLVRFLAVLTILWCTTASTRLLEVGCGMAHQRYLIAYPIALLYTAFVLITIF